MSRTLSHLHFVCWLALALAGFASRTALAFRSEVMNSTAAVLTTQGIDRFVCSGVAIAPTVIVTVAHCVAGKERVYVSFTDWVGNTLRKFDKVSMDSVHIHPSYNRENSFYLNDVAVLLLDSVPRGAPAVFPTILASVPEASDVLSAEGVGYGFRNRRNIRFWRELDFLKYVEGQYLEFKDNQSVLGDSGGPIFLTTPEGTFLASVNSTALKDIGTEWPIYKRSVFLGEFVPWIRALAQGRLTRAVFR